MYALNLLYKLIGNYCRIDKRILQTLFEATVTLMCNKKLSIAEIGRAIGRKIKIKNAIKCIDRLFGNKTLHQRKNQIYHVMIKWLLRCIKRPLILVDWSGLTRCGTYQTLRASLSIKGRGMVLYEQTCGIWEYNKTSTYRRFLQTLAALLPQDCCPILVTDAGFKNNWFSLVRKRGR